MQKTRGYNAQTLVNYIIDYSNDNEYSLKAVRLHKILYAVQGLSFKLLNKEAFIEEIEAWNYGPVVADVYYKNAHKGSSEFTQHDKITTKIVFVEGNEYEWEIKEAYTEDIDQSLIDIIQKVVVSFSNRKDFNLVKWSHTHDAWKSVYTPSDIHKIITKESIRKQFS